MIKMLLCWIRLRLYIKLSSEALRISFEHIFTWYLFYSFNKFQLPSYGLVFWTLKSPKIPFYVILHNITTHLLSHCHFIWPQYFIGVSSQFPFYIKFSVIIVMYQVWETHFNLYVWNFAKTTYFLYCAFIYTVFRLYKRVRP